MRKVATVELFSLSLVCENSFLSRVEALLFWHREFRLRSTRRDCLPDESSNGSSKSSFELSGLDSRPKKYVKERRDAMILLVIL